MRQAQHQRLLEVVGHELEADGQTLGVLTTRDRDSRQPGQVHRAGQHRRRAAVDAQSLAGADLDVLRVGGRSGEWRGRSDEDVDIPEPLREPGPDLLRSPPRPRAPGRGDVPAVLQVRTGKRVEEVGKGLRQMMPWLESEKRTVPDV